MIGLALGLAYLLNQSWLRFSSGFRLLTFLPAVTTLVAYAVVFRVMLATDGGAINQMIGLVGMAPIDWLNNEVWARVALIGAITWRWTGYNMVIILAGLQAIPAELYEAARIDGAGRWQIFTKVVIPQLRPVLIFTTITSTIGALQLFDENYILTEGGPSDATLTPVLYLYKVGFQQFDFGYASAIAWLLVDPHRDHRDRAVPTHAGEAVTATSTLTSVNPGRPELVNRDLTAAGWRCVAASCVSRVYLRARRRERALAAAVPVDGRSRRPTPDVRPVRDAVAGLARRRAVEEPGAPAGVDQLQPGRC